MRRAFEAALRREEQMHPGALSTADALVAVGKRLI